MGRGILVAGLVAALLGALSATACANTIELAAGEQFAKPVVGASHKDADYYTEPRDTHLLTAAVWRVLRQEHVALSLHLRYGRDFGPAPKGLSRRADVLGVLRTANRYHVPVNAWLVVPYADGYWANAANEAKTRAAVDAFFTWEKRRRVRTRGVLLDLEASFQDATTISNLRTDPAAVVSMLRDNVGPARQCRVMHDYARLIASIRARGKKVIASAYPFYLDDIVDGDLALSDGMGLPVITPGELDEVGFMTMRSVFQQLLGADPGPSLQADYAKTVARWFPREGSLVLGAVGTAPYDHLDALVDDVRTVATVNPNPIGIYSLEGILGSFGLDGLRQVLAAARQPLPAGAPELTPSGATLADRATISSMDAMVAAGTPLATTQRDGAPELPNAWPPAC